MLNSDDIETMTNSSGLYRQLKQISNFTVVVSQQNINFSYFPIFQPQFLKNQGNHKQYAPSAYLISGISGKKGPCSIFVTKISKFPWWPLRSFLLELAHDDIVLDDLCSVFFLDRHRRQLGCSRGGVCALASRSSLIGGLLSGVC